MFQRLTRRLKRCNACHHSPQIASRISEVQYLVEDYKTSLSSYITASADSSKIEKLKKEAAVIGNRLIGLTQKMTLEASEHLEQKTKIALSEVSRTKIFLMVTIALTALLAVLLSLLSYKCNRPSCKRACEGDEGGCIRQSQL